MELKNIISSFDIYHKIVIDTLVSKGVKCDHCNDLLRVLGHAFLKFLTADKKRLAINLPIYDQYLVQPIADYLLNIDLLFKAVCAPKVSNFFGTSIFDVFSDESSSRDPRAFLSFSRVADNTIFFDGGIIISKERFFPLFKTNQILKADFSNEIDEAFFLFSKIAKAGIISHPVLFDLENDLSLFVSKSEVLASKKLSTHEIVDNKMESEDVLDECLDRLSALDITKVIALKYPYHSNIDSRIFAEFRHAKLFELYLRTRFSFSEIGESDIYFLRREIENKPDLKIDECTKNYKICVTNHDQPLYKNLAELKQAWQTLNLSPFRYPFPAKWLMCIHRGEPLKFWKALYESDFPAIKGSLLGNVQKVIDQIYEINWIDKFITVDQDAIAVSRTSHLFPTAFDSFNDYIRPKFKKVFIYEDRVPFMAFRGKRVVVLDPLNKILISNISHLLDECDVRIVVPDFIYFTSPLVKYHSIACQYEALLQGSRSWFDKNYSKNQEKWSEQKRALLSNILKDKKKYDKTYAAVEYDDNVEELITENDVPLDLIEPEVVDILVAKERQILPDTNTQLLITTDQGNNFSLKQNSQVLLEENGYVIQTKAAIINEGTNFLPLSEVSKIVQRSALIDKLASMPTSALNWKARMFEKNGQHRDLYTSLQELGLSIQRSTFEKDYLREEKILNARSLNLPRAKNDWRIVCEFLNIKEANEAWRYHKCREDINSLKRAYTQIIRYLSESNSFGNNADSSVLECVMDIFEKETGVVENEGQEERLVTAKSIIRDISKKLILQQAISIKRIENEQDTRKAG